MEEFLTPLSLLMPAFSLPKPPRLASAAASLAWERSPTEFQLLIETFSVVSLFNYLSLYVHLSKSRLLHLDLYKEIPTISATHIVPDIFGAESLDQ